MHHAAHYRWLVLTRHLRAEIAPTSVLDVGCDDGYLLSRIDARLKVGIDIAPPPLEKQHSLVIRADALHLPFKAGSFDTVLALDVLEHVHDDEALLTELIEAVADGGRAYLSVPSQDFEILPRLMTRRAERGWGHVRRGYSLEELEGKLPANVQATATYWNEPFFRAACVPLRVASRLMPGVARRVAAFCAWLDNLVRQGSAGHIYLEIRKR